MSTSLSWTFFPGRAPRTAQIEKRESTENKKLLLIQMKASILWANKSEMKNNIEIR